MLVGAPVGKDRHFNEMCWTCEREARELLSDLRVRVSESENSTSLTCRSGGIGTDWSDRCTSQARDEDIDITDHVRAISSDN